MTVDNTLTDACELLGDMGSCNPSKNETCSDFKKTKHHLEKLCDIKEKREDKRYNPDDWTTLGDWEYKKFKRDDYFTILFIIGIFIPMSIFYTFIHESGHWLVATMFGWEVIDFQLALFPFVLDSFGGYIVALVPWGALDWQLVMLSAGGSLHSLLWAYIFFALFYKLKMHRFAEIALVLYSSLLGLDALIYIFGDLFLGNIGDWYRIFQISPLVVGIIFLLSILNVILFAVNFKKISRRMDF